MLSSRIQWCGGGNYNGGELIRLQLCVFLAYLSATYSHLRSWRLVYNAFPEQSCKEPSDDKN